MPARETPRCQPTRNRATLIGAVHLLLIEKGKILLLRRANTGYADGLYSVPAGHVDPGESATAAAVREAAEEVGISVSPLALDFAHVMHRRSVGTDCANSERVDFFFVTGYWSGTPVNAEPHKCDDLRWHSLELLPANLVEYVRRGIEYYRSGVLYSQMGWKPPCPRCGSGGDNGAVMTR